MSQNTALIFVAVLFVLLLPLVPKIVSLRIKVLRTLKMNRFANFHERHIGVLTNIVRTVFVVFALVLFFLGVSGSS